MFKFFKYTLRCFVGCKAFLVSDDFKTELQRNEIERKIMPFTLRSECQEQHLAIRTPEPKFMLDPIIITLLSYRVHRQNTKQQNKKASVSAWNHGNSHIAVIFYKKNMHTKFIKLVSRGNRYYRDKGN